LKVSLNWSMKSKRRERNEVNNLTTKDTRRRDNFQRGWRGLKCCIKKCKKEAEYYDSRWYCEKHFKEKLRKDGILKWPNKKSVRYYQMDQSVTVHSTKIRHSQRYLAWKKNVPYGLANTVFVDWGGWKSEPKNNNNIVGFQSW